MLGCATSPAGKGPPFDERFQKDLDRSPIRLPQSPVESPLWNRIEDRGPRQVYRALDLPQHARAVGDWLGANGPREAANVNAWEEVPDSTWFANRILKGSLADTELLRQEHPGPSLEPYWTVIAGKTAGVSPGFTIKDSRGDMYFIKFDPPGFDGLSTGAEVISSLILNAAGYHVPHNTVAFVEPGLFRLGEGARMPGKYDVKRPMSEEDLYKILSRLNLRPDGTVRVVASLALEGRPVGPFLYEGTRADDPNDRILHQNRREVRAYHLFAAWLNNTDILPKNTLDMYVGAEGEGHLTHNVLDFGSSLGAGGDGPKARRSGYEHYVDYAVVARNLVTLGFRVPKWESAPTSDLLSVGFFSARDFDPRTWKPQYSNAALEAITNLDAFWATRIIMRFREQDLAAIVSKAQLPEPEAAPYMLRTLIERRDRFGRIWLRMFTPLDEITLVNGDGSWHLELLDLAVATGIDEASNRTVSATMAWGDGPPLAATATIPDDGRLVVPIAPPPGTEPRPGLAGSRPRYDTHRQGSASTLVLCQSGCLCS